MDILGLTYFCDAAKSENFSKTARRFLVPTSNISQVIKRLEEELGTRLFDRHGNKVMLNAQGKRFYEHARAALDSIETAKHSVAAEDEENGEIRLLVASNRRRVADGIEKFGKSHPGISFYLSHSPSDSPADYDIIISDTPPALDGYDKSLFVREQLMLAASRDSSLSHYDKIDAKRLESERFITMPADTSLTRATRQIFASLDISPKISITCDDPSIIRRYIELGLGVAIVPSCSWDGVLSSGVKLIDIGEYFRDTYVFYKSGRRLTARAAAFMKVLLELAKI